VTDSFSQITRSSTFKLRIACVQAIQASSATPVTYFISDTQLSVQIPAFSLTPSTCVNELTIQAATLADGSNLPSSITHDSSRLKVFESDFSATGDFVVRVTVADPWSQITNSDLLVSVAIKCAKSIHVSPSYPATISYFVGSPALVLPGPRYKASPLACQLGAISFQLLDSSG
jgi:hypothetical protein